MILEKILNSLRGEVRIRVESPFPERVLNLCGAQGLSFWDLRWESAQVFTCRLSRQDYGALRRLAGKLECTLTPEKRSGVPFFLGRFRRRRALLVGLAACAAGLFFGSFFIWDFTITGNAAVSDEEILRALERNGVAWGTFGFELDSEDLRNHVLLEIPGLSWISVNVSGCRARVEVRERKEPPELLDRRAPSNVVARRDGLVLEVQALEGEKMVLPGTTVQAGQLLISGVEDTDTFGARVKAGLGKVWARTWYRLTVRMPLQKREKCYTGEERSCFALDFGTRRINLLGNSSISGREYDKLCARTRLSFFGLPLPVTAVRETLRFYTTRETAADLAEAQQTGKAILSEYLRSLLPEDGTVSSALCSSRQEGNVLAVTLTAECREQIGRVVPIQTDAAG